MLLIHSLLDIWLFPPLALMNRTFMQGHLFESLFSIS